MLIKQMETSKDLKNFSYIIACEETKMAAIIDPSVEFEPLMKEIKSNNLKVKYIINTHTHWDHIAGNNKIKDESTIVVQYKTSNKADLKVNDGDTISLGNIELKILYTPGHSKEDICILVEGHLFTGDTLFVGKVGGTSKEEESKKQFESLKKLMNLPDNTKVWPGHDNGKFPSSTIKIEREKNPFCIRLNSIDDFLYLKKNWLQFKEEQERKMK